MTAEWYYAKNKQKTGPLTEDELHSLLAALEIELTPAQVRWLDLEDDHSQIRPG